MSDSEKMFTCVLRVAVAITVALGLYVGSYLALMVPAPVFSVNGDAIYGSAFRFGGYEVCQVGGSTTVCGKETWFNKLYLPLDYIWGRARKVEALRSP